MKILGIQIRPREIKKPKYWLHLALITLLIQLGLRYLFNHNMFSITWFFKIGILLGLADIIVHTVLKLD